MARVNLHCHSIFSDGELSPEAAVDRLAAAGVRYAALTDHDSVEGLARFAEAARRRGIGCVPGVELTTACDGREAHLLGYGIDASDPELCATLVSLRQARGLEVHSIAGALRKSGAPRANGDPAATAAPDGRLDIGRAIALIHRAGGRAFLAHPFTVDADPAALDALLPRLKAAGLDGLEALYEPFSPEQRAQLAGLAEKHGLLVCAGTDLHTASGPSLSAAAVDMPDALWKPFRDAVSAGPAFHDPLDGPGAPAAPASVPARPRPHPYRRRYFVLRILLPALLAVALFVAGIWVLIIPAFERSLLDRKREMIRELTNSASSILASYERDEQAGRVTRQEAQALAAARIEALRYGPESKDYFWLQDMTPRIVMHPYRPDLNGQDVSGFTDARGTRIFVEFADLVRRKQEGYIAYVWQWQDDPERLKPKESYVKGFAPWGWVIGTGMYIDDVQAEIARLEQSLVAASAGVSAGVIALLLLVVQQSLRIERQRRDVEESLRESTERYRSLVEATTEGALLVLDGRCRYANPVLLRMLGCTARQLELLDLADLLPRDADNGAAWEHVERATAEPGVANGAAGFEGVLRRSDGQLVECVMALNPISFAGSAGFILLAKDVLPPPDAPEAEEGAAAASAAGLAAPVGLFQARAARRGVFVELNAEARALLGALRLAGGPQPGLADLFGDPADYEAFVAQLHQAGSVVDRLVRVETPDAQTRALALSATLIRDAPDRPARIDGALRDVTAVEKRDAEREALIERLQTSLSFLHEPVGRLGRDVVRCGVETPIDKLAAHMTARNATAALVETEGGAPIGIVTDHDLRERVVAGRMDPRAPARAIMSAPLVTLSEHALIYEALMRMEEKGVQHLAVTDEDGRVVSIVCNKDLIQFQRYGATVLTRDIARAVTPEDVARACARAPGLVRALADGGARPHNITHLLSSACDAACEGLIGQAVGALGPPPAPFAFLAMGSHGRFEQTLFTDQDNAIVYADPTDAEAQAAASAYFPQLGARVCGWLEQAGYPACRGQFMASNPRWCQPLAQWKRAFEGWIVKAEPQELLEFSIFFDFRTVHGDAGFALEMRRHVHGLLDGHPAFFPHFARQALVFEPPRRLFGGIYVGGAAADHAGQLNLKDALMPIVGFARLYALRHGVDHTNTLDRLDALVERDAVLPASRDDIAAAYDVLMRLRLQRQLAAWQAGQPLDNVIQPRQLKHADEALLRQAFSQIAAVQKKIGYDFFGSAGSQANP